MICAEQLAAFVARASFQSLSEGARTQLKIRVLDSIGCAIGATGGEPVRFVREQIDTMRRLNMFSPRAIPTLASPANRRNSSPQEPAGADTESRNRFPG